MKQIPVQKAKLGLFCIPVATHNNTQCPRPPPAPSFQPKSKIGIGLADRFIHRSRFDLLIVK